MFSPATRLFALAGLAIVLNFAPTAAIADGTSQGEAGAAPLPTIEEFLAFQEQLHADLQDGKYGRIGKKDMKLVEDSQATLQRLLSSVASVDDLTAKEKVAVFNAQEAIKAVLVENDRDRVICKREHTVGTNRKVTRCYTPAEAEMLRQRSSDAIGWMNRSAALPSGG